MKTIQTKAHKLCLSTALIISALFTQGAWACETPEVTGYDLVLCLSGDLAGVRKDDKWGAVDKTGQVVIPLQYDRISFPTNNKDLMRAEKDGKWGFIDHKGNEIAPLQYNFVLMFGEGLAGVEKDGKWGFIDNTGKVVIPLEFTWIESDFDNGVAIVHKINEQGHSHRLKIDKMGNILAGE